MKKAMLFFGLMLGVFAGNAQTKAAPQTAAGQWTVDAAHSSLKFTVSHLTVSEVEGRFKVYTGSVAATGTDFANATVKFSADVASINTDNDMRDNHLKSGDFFDATKYPQMNFVSTGFKKTSGNKYVLEGNLTIKDVTQKVKLDVTGGGIMKDPYGNIKAGFKATGKISRKAYGLKWSALTEAGGAVVGDEVTIIANLEYTKDK